jgi:TrmH family RNA methyltransferase
VEIPDGIAARTSSITSMKNARIKAAMRLRDRRGRTHQERFVIDGLREISRAIDSGVHPAELYMMDPTPTEWAAQVQELLTQLDPEQTELFLVPRHVFERISFGDRTEGLLAVVDTPLKRLKHLKIEEYSPDVVPLFGILERVEKPGNVGAVLRSADGAGLTGLILADKATDLYNPNSVRASMGTIFSVPTATASSERTLEWLREHELQIVTARVDGSRPYTEIDFKRPTAIVLGNEADGLSDQWQGDDMQATRLPMNGIADSLNVSTSAAVLFYEALRQRSV